LRHVRLQGGFARLSLRLAFGLKLVAPFLQIGDAGSAVAFDSALTWLARALFLIPDQRSVCIALCQTCPGSGAPGHSSVILIC
jgi:hypothetical protein